MPTYEEVFENNRKWVEENVGERADFFSRLASGQDPDFLVIGCSDSRVPPAISSSSTPSILRPRPSDVQLRATTRSSAMTPPVISRPVTVWPVTASPSARRSTSFSVTKIFSVLAIRDNVAPPTLNLDNPSVATAIDLVPHDLNQSTICGLPVNYRS